MSTAHHEDIDAHTGTTTTGHEWDGIRELNTPLPKWWLYIFYATIVWSFGYFIVYPSWPLISSYSPGVLGWSSRGAVTADLVSLQQQRAPMVSALNAASLSDIAKDEKLRGFAIAQGRARLWGQLRAVPWIGRRRIAKLPQPERRRLAMGRHARRHSSNDRLWNPFGPRTDTRGRADARVRTDRHVEARGNQPAG